MPSWFSKGGDMVNTQHSGALIGIEAALRYRGSVWLRGPEDSTGIVLCGVDESRPFALVIHGLMGAPSRNLMAVLTDWRKAGASTGLAGTIKDALMIVAGADSRAS